MTHEQLLQAQEMVNRLEVLRDVLSAISSPVATTWLVVRHRDDGAPVGRSVRLDKIVATAEVLAQIAKIDEFIGNARLTDAAGSAIEG